VTLAALVWVDALTGSLGAGHGSLDLCECTGVGVRGCECV
jgi:hypothetical protein